MKIDKKHKFEKFFKKHKGKNPRKIDFLTFHHIETDSIESAVKMLKDHEVSSHYTIDYQGRVFLIVDENDIAYHAGKSFWRGCDDINKNSVGIEFLSPDILNKKFSKKQLESGLELCKKIIKKHKIKPENIMAHSDIAHYPKNFSDADGMKIAGFLDRKQDPSHQFDWRYFAKNGVGIYPKIPFRGKDRILFRNGDKYEEIAQIKQKLSDFGYKIKNKNDIFDIEMMLLVRVFNRRFNQKRYSENPDFWWKSSGYALDQIV